MDTFIKGTFFGELLYIQTVHINYSFRNFLRKYTHTFYTGHDNHRNDGLVLTTNSLECRIQYDFSIKEKDNIFMET